MRRTARIVVMFVVNGRALAEERPPTFWERVADPGRMEFVGALREGVLHLEESRRDRPGARSPASVAAVEAFRRATVASPRRPEGWQALGESLARIDEHEAAIQALLRASALGGSEYDVRAEIPFELGILYSKLGRFEEALVEYERVLSAAIDDGRRSVVLSNSAEALMALGRMSEAIDRYRRAIEVEPQNPSVLTGAYWGLAVALDRDEQIAESREASRHALSLDSAIAYFSDTENIFFVPKGDVHYYQALAYEAAGRPEQAKASWNRFVELLPQSPWVYRARQHLSALERRPRSRTKPHGAEIRKPPKIP